MGLNSASLKRQRRSHQTKVSLLSSESSSALQERPLLALLACSCIRRIGLGTRSRFGDESGVSVPRQLAGIAILWTAQKCAILTFLILFQWLDSSARMMETKKLKNATQRKL